MTPFDRALSPHSSSRWLKICTKSGQSQSRTGSREKCRLRKPRTAGMLILHCRTDTSLTAGPSRRPHPAQLPYKDPDRQTRSPARASAKRSYHRKKQAAKQTLAQPELVQDDPDRTGLLPLLATLVVPTGIRSPDEHFQLHPFQKDWLQRSAFFNEAVRSALLACLTIARKNAKTAIIAIILDGTIYVGL